MKLYIVCNARLPSKKAYGIQVAKMCEAFIEQGVDVELIVPRTHAFISNASMQDFYRLRTPVPTHAVYAPDWYSSGYFGFIFSSFVFMITSALYLVSQRTRGVAYAVDTDRFSFFSLWASGMPYVVEIDMMPVLLPLGKFFLHRARGVVAINTEVKKDVTRKFGLGENKVIAAPNGVDERLFESISKEDARTKLGLPHNVRIAAYVGRFYEWKGLDILAEVSKRFAAEDMLVVVGGSREEFLRVTNLKDIPNALRLMGECESYEVPLWLAAADVLLVLGTEHNEQSYRFTAPMKVYEYMLSRRPIVASDAPSLRAIIPTDDVLWYKPDSVEDLAKKITLAFETGERIQAMCENAHSEALLHTWTRRARTLVDFIKTRTAVH